MPLDTACGETNKFLAAREKLLVLADSRKYERCLISMSITAFPSVAFLRCLGIVPVSRADVPSVVPPFYHAFFYGFEALFKQSLSLSIIHCFILSVLYVYPGFKGRVA